MGEDMGGSMDRGRMPRSGLLGPSIQNMHIHRTLSENWGWAPNPDLEKIGNEKLSFWKSKEQISLLSTNSL